LEGDEVETLAAIGDAGVDAFSGGVELLDSLRGGPVQGDIGGEPPIFEEVTALKERAEVGVSGVHEFNEPLREGLRGIVFVRVVG
jgi:hypothetical protein